jgi:hypothetical protein
MFSSTYPRIRFVELSVKKVLYGYAIMEETGIAKVLNLFFLQKKNQKA